MLLLRRRAALPSQPAQLLYQKSSPRESIGMNPANHRTPLGCPFTGIPPAWPALRLNRLTRLGTIVLAVLALTGLSTVPQGTTPPASAPPRIGPFDVQDSPGQAATGYTVGGEGWYRKHFRLGGGNQHVEVRFDGVYQNADFWLNGTHLGFHPYGYTSFSDDLTPYLNAGGANVLAVRVRNLGKNSRWYSGSGIIRHVWLTVTAPLRIPQWGVQVTTPAVSKAAGTVHIKVSVVNGEAAATREAHMLVSVLDAEGRRVGRVDTPVQCDPDRAQSPRAGDARRL